MESHELLRTFRCDVVDDVEPYLWSNREVYQYINDAYFMFVREMGGIADATTPEVVDLVASTGVATTPIHESILRFRTARNTTLKQPITIINIQDTDDFVTDDYGLLHREFDSTEQGRPTHMIIGEEDGYVRWMQVPDADYNVKVVVERLPLIPITRERQRFTGVREEHHYHLLKWVRHLAYRKQDADTFNLVKSDQERNDFYEYCELAKREKGTRKHKVRVTRYGGL